ncbi:MAG: VOC family protein [Proteobacteria bacterium]|nr:VOC family protein [Pseudomonadota bacterium]
MASLDHLGTIVTDLAAGAARWERLGFRLSPLSRQRGRMPGRDADGPWATANRCAIFRHGYLELIGIVDAAAFNPWTKFLARFEGLHLLALRVPDADAAYAELSARTATLNAPVQRERKLDVDGVEATMRFRNIFSRDESYPEGRYIVLEHQTPEYLWQPRYLAHPNGALALEAALVCADDAHAQAVRLESIVGRAPSEGAHGTLVFHPPQGGTIELHGLAAFEARYGWRPQALPAFAGVEVRFTDRAQAAKLMGENGIPVEKRGDEWFVAPQHTNGFILRMSQ